MEKLIKPLQQWAMEDNDNRGVLVITTNEEMSGCDLTRTYANVAKAIACQASKIPELHRVLLMGLFAATKNNRFLSLRFRLVKWLLV